MTYQADLKFNDWVFQLGTLGNTLIDQLLDGAILAQKFYSATYGKSDAELATEWERTTEDIAKLRYALQALSDLRSALNNGTIAARDREGDLVPFL